MAQSLSFRCSSQFASLRNPVSGWKLTAAKCTSPAPAQRALRLDTRCVNGGKAATNVGVRLIGTGSAAPKTVFTNDDLAKVVDTTDEWIAARTGIRRRHILESDGSLAELSATSAQQALDMGGVDPKDVDMIIVCTSSPDDIFGSACEVQRLVGAENAVAFDLTAACSGFVVGLINASMFVRGGAFKNVLVIGADALSRYVDWRDRSTCILFGDGSGAVLLQGVETDDCSLLGFDMCSDGRLQKNLVAPFEAPGVDKDHIKPESEAASGLGTFHNISMNGGEIFKFAVRAVPETVQRALSQTDLEVADINWLVLHQANQRILDSAANRLGVPPENVVSNIEEYGNTSAASIPLAFDEAVRSGKVKQGDVIAMAGFGAGLTWASSIVRWGA